MHYYQFNIADYRKDTAHLTLLEHGIYRQLLDSYYLDEKPIETKSVMRRLQIATDEEKKAFENVLSDFFTLSECGNFYTHKRIEAEIAKYKSRGWFPSDPNVTTLRPKIDEWKQTIKRIHKRDNYTCQYCQAVGGRLECDHIVPVSRGGANSDDNLCTACFSCNRSKSNKLLSEWRPGA